MIQIFFLLLAIVAVTFLYKIIKNITILVLNSVIGFFALIGYNYLFQTEIQINIWSVLITVVGGIIGFILVLISHYSGWAF